jgi:VWFA-related protein
MPRYMAVFVGFYMVSAQAAPAAPPQPQLPPSPIIKVTSHLVQVSVAVHDKTGSPVTNLKKEDFALYDNGQEQQIRLFAVENSGSVVPPVPPLPAGVFANREWNVRGSSGRTSLLPRAVTVILLDGLNTRFQDQQAAKQGLIGFLSQIQPGDRVALYLLSNGLKVLHDFTSDTASLIEAVNRYKSGSFWTLDASTASDAHFGRDEMDAYLSAVGDRVTEFYQARRLETTLEALTAIANHLAGIPGRKNLIWLSDGFPLFVGTRVNGSAGREFQDYSGPMQQAVRTLNSVGVAIYPVDARGLATSADIIPGQSVRTPLRISPDVHNQPPRPTHEDVRAAQDFADSQETMRDVAERTGGRAFLNGNDIAGAIRSAVSDAEVSYELAYSPSHNQWVGQFREIKVKVKRPGLDVRYRKGYFAAPENAGDPEILKADVAGAAASPLASTGLGLRADIVSRPTAETPKAHLHLVIETNNVNFALNEKNQWAAFLDLWLLVRDTHGGTIHQVPRAINLSLKQDQYEMVQKNGISMTLVLEAPPDAGGVRAIARDRTNGALGSLDIPLGK